MTFQEKTYVALQTLLNSGNDWKSGIMILSNSDNKRFSILGNPQEIKSILRSVVYSEPFRSLLYEIILEEVNVIPLEGREAKIEIIKGLENTFSEKTEDSFFFEGEIIICEN